jgi:hypothetical protein
MAGRVRPRRGLVALAAAAGLVAVGWLATSFQQLDTDRRLLRHQLATADQEQATERFARALDQLGSEQLDVRLGGIYGLERIAARGSALAGDAAAYRPPGADDPGWWPAQDRVQVFEILSAYVRTTSRRPPFSPPGGSTLASRQPDVQAAATVLGRRAVLAGDPALDLSGALLAGAQLERARLDRANLRGADLRGSGLRDAELAGAHLDGALLCGAQLQGAELAGASLAGARVSAATGWPAGFDWRAAGARLVRVCLS